MATASRDRRLGPSGAPIHSIYGAYESVLEQALETQPTAGASGDRGSLPNLDELANQPLQMPREEAARLASQRRLETQRQHEEEELLHQNPLRYLMRPQLRVIWLG